MINKCKLKDKQRIIELGSLIKTNFSNVNDIENIINSNEIIGYYDNNMLVGFLIYKKLYEVIELLYIVVDPVYRRHGIGYSLICELKKQEHDKIILEVSVDNKNAIKLYKKCGFIIINIRKKYYDGIDAYVMEAIK